MIENFLINWKKFQLENDMEIVKKGWGYEKIIVNKPEYCGKILLYFTILKCWPIKSAETGSVYTFWRVVCTRSWNALGLCTSLARHPCCSFPWSAVGGQYRSAR